MKAPWTFDNPPLEAGLCFYIFDKYLNVLYYISDVVPCGNTFDSNKNLTLAPSGQKGEHEAQY